MLGTFYYEIYIPFVELLCYQFGMTNLRFMRHKKSLYVQIFVSQENWVKFSYI